MSDGLQPKQPRGLDGSPLPRGAVRQRNHHRLQVLAHDLELAHALELHRLACEVLARGDGVGEDVQKQRTRAGSVYSEGDHVTHDRLTDEDRNTQVELNYLA